MAPHAGRPRARASRSHGWRRSTTASTSCIGAYTETLRADARRSASTRTRVLQRLPLTLRFPDGGGLRTAARGARRRRSPADVLAAGAAGRWRDAARPARAATRWQRRAFAAPGDDTVADLVRRPAAPRVRAELIEPLCVSALNTPPDGRAARVFLRVLRDALFGSARRRDLLLPRVDLGASVPGAAGAGWLARHGARSASAHRVRRARARRRTRWRVDGERFDRVVLACQRGRGRAPGRRIAPAWAALADALALRADRHRLLQRSTALACRADARAAQRRGRARRSSSFDRGRLGGPAGLLAFVDQRARAGSSARSPAPRRRRWHRPRRARPLAARRARVRAHGDRAAAPPSPAARRSSARRCTSRRVCSPAATMSTAPTRPRSKARCAAAVAAAARRDRARSVSREFAA